MLTEPKVGTIFSKEEHNAIKKVLNSGDFLTRGKDVELFEKEFAKYCQAKYAIALSSCGAALKLSSQILDLKKGDEVICQSNSFWVTYNHLLERNVTIKCADIEKDSLNICPKSVKKLITKKTKAVYLVHHGGNPADLDSLRKILRPKKIPLIEDSAHAVGAKYKGNKIGHQSDISVYSFSTYKMISTLGEGGMFVTNNKKYADYAKLLRTNFPFGKTVKRKSNMLGNYQKPSDTESFSDSRLRASGKNTKAKYSDFLRMGDAWDFDWKKLNLMGSTYRMTTVQAAVGRIQLKKLEMLIKLRSNVAKIYNKTISEIPYLEPLKVIKGCRNSWWIFNFFIKENSPITRDELVKTLFKKYKIQMILRHFPINLNGVLRMQGCNSGGCKKCGKLENVEQVWFSRQLSLPISPQMKISDVKYITLSIKKVFKKYN